MFKKMITLLCFCMVFGACSFRSQIKEQKGNPARAQNFAEASSVFKIELDEKLGAGSSLLLFIDYDKQESFYMVKILGAFSSVLLKVKYDLNSFSYDFQPQLLENKQIKELFEQTLEVLIGQIKQENFACSFSQCVVSKGGDMFKNKYIFSAYNQAGFAQDILCYYRRGVVKINLHLLRLNL